MPPSKPERGPVWLVLPTYEEATNIESLVEEARGKLPADAQVLIVDDNSRDGTGEIAARLTEEHEAVHFLHRPAKEGLGPAYIAGFRRALAGGAGLIVEMDSDFSHEPAYLPRLIEAAERADIVIGSRYVPGGGVTDWGPVRRAISRGGSAYAQFVLGLQVRDLTGGFKCFRREVLEALDLDAVRSRGYAFQVEMTYRAIELGFDVVEVPIVFRDRQAGTSKMSRSIVLEAIWRVPRLRYGRWRQRAIAALANLAILYEVLSARTSIPRRPIPVTGKLQDVTDDTFKSEVLEADGPVLVDFWAPWCGPCRVVHPVLEEMETERDDLHIVSINVDENQQTAAQYEVLSIPTLILSRTGRSPRR